METSLSSFGIKRGRRQDPTLVALLAFGYHTAAIRGEVPREVSVDGVAAWLEGRPVYGWVRSQMKKSNARWWLTYMAALIIEQLKQISVVEGSIKAEVEKAAS